MSDVALTDIEPDELQQDAPPTSSKRKSGGTRTDGTKSMTPSAIAQRKRRAANRAAGKPEPSHKKGSGKRNLTGEIEALLSLLASVWAIRDEECATVLDAQAHDIAAGLNAWAQRDPKVYAMLVRWLEGGGAGALAFAIWPLALQVANHHVMPAIERRRELIAERQAAFDEAWQEPETLEEAANVPAEATTRFIPPNVIPDGQ